MPVKISPTDTNRDIRHQQIRSRASNSTRNRNVHITLPLSLARCPFCGDPAQIVDDEAKGGNAVECTKCLALGPSGDNPGEAARMWNTRMVLKKRSHGS